ncbi:MAG: DUF2110 family protein [Euryarchaeota archaeon]|nr:DUF2110 family protein [Euryarchaeota archaeon]
MRETVLCIKAYSNPGSVIASIRTTIGNELKDLDVLFDLSITKNKWVQVNIEGDDEEFAANFLINKYGSPTTEPQVGTHYRGYIISINDKGIAVDIGITLLIPTESLKPLGAGDSHQIASRFGMIPHIPVLVEIVEHGDKTLVRFTKKQIDLWWDWKRSGTDRVIVNSVTRSKLKVAIKKTGHGKDIYGIDRLGVMENAIICREGTDGPGIVAHIGPLLKSDIGVIIGS